MAGEQLSFDLALAATLEDFKLNFSLKLEQRTALESFKKKEDIKYVIFFVALVGCSAILLRAERI